MKTTKRLLAVLLAMVLLCVSVPVAVQAAGLAPTGSCGENLTWTFDSETGALFIQGTGAINQSAFEGCTQLKSVTVGENVTEIGGRAFYRCSNLSRVVLQNSITTIHGGAFSACSSLSTITIPNSVAIIGDSAFYNCTKLWSITLPVAITDIGERAFDYCDALKDVYYAGSEEDWSQISIGYYNYHLTSYPSIHFMNYRHDHYEGTAVVENCISSSCTTPSHYDSVVFCSICGEELSRELIYEGEPDPSAHTAQTYTTPSTCAENGFTITICTRCGETLSKEILPRLDHNWTSEVTQNPTCTAQGVKTYTCESCAETYTEPVDVLAHEWDDGKMTKDPSCTEAGEMTYTCATGGETRTEPIDKLDHEIVLVAGKAASCTEPGLTDGWQCKNCKKWFAEQQTIPALDHDPQIGAVVEPTCEAPGYTPFICTRCGETVSKTDPTDALGHDMQPTYVWAKDDSTVTATMICTRCEAIGATETAEVKTEITVKPTCSTEGELTLIAAFNNKSFYGQTKTKTLPRDPDAHVFKVTVTPPTCLDDGYTTHACTLCRYGYSDEIVSALGHKPVTDEAVPATCEAPGLTEGSHCSVCGEVLTAQEETSLADHTDADNDGLCDTCEQQMTGGDHCKYCGKVHDGAFGWLISFFHSILAIFKR